MSRPKGTGKPSDVEQARKRLVDARPFLEAAKLPDAPDVVATCAIHAAIAASDAITCHALGERSNDGKLVSAVDLLRQVDAKLATALKRALDRKTQAGYESVDISAADAASCLKWAGQLNRFGAGFAEASPTPHACVLLSSSGRNRRPMASRTRSCSPGQRWP